MKQFRSALLLILIIAMSRPGSARVSEALNSVLEVHGKSLVADAAAGSSDSKVVFRTYCEGLLSALEDNGDTETARRIRGALSGDLDPGIAREEVAWIIHTFAREYYLDDVITSTSELIRFRTFATDVPNRENPEFVRQREYLRELAGRLGLNFNNVGGFVQEVWIGGGDGSFGIMSHSDVQPVERSEWSRDPWSGEVVDGAIWGRGSVDDKGPICAVLYGMRALLDSGIPLRQKIILLVGTDEESANEDVSTYLQDHEPPDRTIVVDSNYPVVCAEKGWGGIWLTLARTEDTQHENGLRIAGLRSGFSPSIVPEKAEARLINVGGSATDAVPGLKAAAAEFESERSGSRLLVEERSDTLLVTTFGKSVHSSVPETGHNALMDLLVFLDRKVKLLPNEFSVMASFASQYIGFELDGESLGIAHHDDFMGDLTVAADMFQYTDSTVTFMFNFRMPRGISREQVETALDLRFDEFGRTHGVTFTDFRYVGEPLYTDPDSEFVRRLLGIYNRITGESLRARSIGGGTYAQRIPNAVVFGPALPDEEYLGHQPNEQLRISTLIRNLEILSHTMVEFGF